MNSQLSKKVIDLHNKGYELDFVVDEGGQLVCLQNNHEFESCSTLVTLVLQGLDHYSGRYKYIHTIETVCGDKGLLLSECVQLTLIYPHILRNDSAYTTTNI